MKSRTSCRHNIINSHKHTVHSSNVCKSARNKAANQTHTQRQFGNNVALAAGRPPCAMPRRVSSRCEMLVYPMSDVGLRHPLSVEVRARSMGLYHVANPNSTV